MLDRKEDGKKKERKHQVYWNIHRQNIIDY